MHDPPALVGTTSQRGHAGPAEAMPAATPPPGARTPLGVLRTVFGYERFRGEQEAIIDAVVRGEDALVLMPTGGGKSLCFQIPALLRPGAGVVVSPLIALMQDQVGQLQQLGVRAAFINSSLDSRDAWLAERDLEAGRLDLVYVAPERLFTERFQALLRRTRLALFAIDEAHCVSQWGHDFRPEYLQLEQLARDFPDVPRIALTATADGPTRAEIVERLGLGRARQFVSSFDRPNIRYAVAHDGGHTPLLDFVRREHAGDAGIVYCLSRKKVERMAEWLVRHGIPALPYHAGMDARARRDNQEAFIHGEGKVVVATIAFGMGIDKPNVRFVAHLDLPKSLEHYYQETGRAGRDGLPASAWMSYGLASVIGLRELMSRSEADERHKRIERHKLDAMLGYCESTECRRVVMLRYFGETYAGPCGNCDTCLAPVASWDGGEAAQKALSCVYRTGQRYGVVHLVDVLTGKATERVRAARHDRLPIFGKGADLDVAAWRSVYRQLVAAGTIGVDVEGYGGLYLTEASGPVLRGELRPRLRRDPAPTPKQARKTARAEKSAAAAAIRPRPDQRIFEALRQHRLELARAQGIPPYLVFNDNTLHELATKKPATLEAMRAISGIGEHKLKRYGASFLAALDRALLDHGVSSR